MRDLRQHEAHIHFVVPKLFQNSIGISLGGGHRGLCQTYCTACSLDISFLNLIDAPLNTTTSLPVAG